MERPLQHHHALHGRRRPLRVPASNAKATIWTALLLQLCLAVNTATAFDFVLLPSSSSYSIRLVDLTTNTSDISTLFRQENVTVHVDGLLWQSASLADVVYIPLLDTIDSETESDTAAFATRVSSDSDNASSTTTTTASMASSTISAASTNTIISSSKISNDNARLSYQTYVNDDIVASGSHDLSVFGTVPPTTMTAGFIDVNIAGRQNVTVALQVIFSNDDNTRDDTRSAIDSNSHSATTTSSNYKAINDNSPVVHVQRYYQSYRAWVTIFPIFVILFLAFKTGNVEISISTTNLISVCIAQGNFFRGTEHLVYGCILGALTDPFNGTVLLLVFFLSGIMSLVDVTGGSKGFVKLVARYVSTTRVVQTIAFACGLCYFWDDVLSILLMGYLFRPLLDMAHTSRPLTAMILSSTAGPITSIVLASTWLAWEIPLLQQELARIDEESMAELDDLIPSPLSNMTPLEVLRKSIAYSFYPIFLLVLLPLLLWSQRHMGQLLMYERITQVYQHQNGGPRDVRGPCQDRLPCPPRTARRFWNALFPIAMISILFLLFWFNIGRTEFAETYPDGHHNDNNVNDNNRMEQSPPSEYWEWVAKTYGFSNVSLAWLQAVSTGTAMFVFSLLMQLQYGNDTVMLLPLSIFKLRRQAKAQEQKQAVEQAEELELREEEDDEEEEAIMAEKTATTSHNKNNASDDNNDNDTLIRPLIPMMDLIASFFFGFSHVMPYMIQFILAWALRDSFAEMGLTRWIAKSFGDQLHDIDVSFLPTAAFLTAFSMSLATGGAARGRVASVLLPMVVAPVYAKTHISNPDMIFQVIGAILSGSVAGDHAAPLSNTSLLSSLSSDCHHLVHVTTQMPYILMVVLLSLIVGTLPAGYGLYPSGVGFFLGIVFLFFFVYFLCCPVLDPNGQWDLATRLFIRTRRPTPGSEDASNESGEHFWDVLQRDTIRAATALSEGLPYNLEDCRPLMIPLDTGSTLHDDDDKEQQTSFPATNSSGSTTIAYHSQDSQVRPSTSRPVRIMATDGEGLTKKQVVNVEDDFAIL